jgi:hypothetical protein
MAPLSPMPFWPKREMGGGGLHVLDGDVGTSVKPGSR